MLLQVALYIWENGQGPRLTAIPELCTEPEHSPTAQHCATTLSSPAPLCVGTKLCITGPLLTTDLGWIVYICFLTWCTWLGFKRHCTNGIVPKVPIHAFGPNLQHPPGLTQERWLCRSLCMQTIRELERSLRITSLSKSSFSLKRYFREPYNLLPVLYIPGWDTLQQEIPCCNSVSLCRAAGVLKSRVGITPCTTFRDSCVQRKQQHGLLNQNNK